jgi:hypothetical protein
MLEKKRRDVLFITALKFQLMLSQTTRTWNIFVLHGFCPGDKLGGLLSCPDLIWLLDSVPATSEQSLTHLLVSLTSTQKGRESLMVQSIHKIVVLFFSSTQLSPSLQATAMLPAALRGTITMDIEELQKDILAAYDTDPSISTTFKQTIHYVCSSHFSFQPHNLPFNRQTLPTSYSRQTPYMVSPRRWPIHLLHHILYGVHQSHFDQSPLFREIILYGRLNEIGVNPYHSILFDTLIKEVFNNLLYILYFGTEHLEHLTPEDWLNIKRLSTDWHFPRITATIVWTLITFQRRLIPPPF